MDTDDDTSTTTSIIAIDKKHFGASFLFACIWYYLCKFNYEIRNMKKSESKAIGTLIIFAIIASPFVWLYEKIGGIGILVIIAIVVGIYALSKWTKNQDSQNEMYQLLKLLFSFQKKKTKQVLILFCLMEFFLYYQAMAL